MILIIRHPNKEMNNNKLSLKNYKRIINSSKIKLILRFREANHYKMS